MKRPETLMIEQVLRNGLFGSNPALAREYGATEVTLGFVRDGRINGATEIVDFLSYDMKKDIYRCYEIKVTMQDFKSSAHKSWYGNYNYLVISSKLYYLQDAEWWKDAIPKDVGLIVIEPKNEIRETIKRAAYRDITDEDKQVLKDSLLRTLFYQNSKLRKDTKNSQWIPCRNKLPHKEVICCDRHGNMTF